MEASAPAVDWQGLVYGDGAVEPYDRRAAREIFQQYRLKHLKQMEYIDGVLALLAVAVGLGLGGWLGTILRPEEVSYFEPTFASIVPALAVMSLFGGFLGYGVAIVGFEMLLPAQRDPDGLFTCLSYPHWPVPKYAGCAGTALLGLAIAYNAPFPVITAICAFGGQALLFSIWWIGSTLWRSSHRDLSALRA